MVYSPNHNRISKSTITISDQNPKFSKFSQFLSHFFTLIHQISLFFLLVLVLIFTCRHNRAFVEEESWKILKNHHCWTWSMFMADANSGSLKLCWAKVPLPFIFLIITGHLFQPIQSKFARNQKLHLQEVRIQPLQFLKLWYGFGRSCNIEHTATWIVPFH